MLYLAMQFAWFLVAAFAIGLLMGWIAADGELRLGGRATVWFVLLWGGAGALTWLQVLNGSAARWVETALLFTAVYVAGCILGALLHPARAAALDAAVLPVSASLASPAAAVPVPAAQPVLPGQRPDGMLAARDGRADDLKLIKGIGRQNEGRLHGLGIWHFSQIAAWTSENVEWIGAYLAFSGRIEREGWVRQASTLAAGGETKFSKRARAGLVESSRDDGSRGQANIAQEGRDGIRPGNLLEAPRDSAPDDLELVKGIGPAIAVELNRLGIWHFDQLAALGDEELRYVRSVVGASGRRGRENWREDADILANGGETAHSRAVKAGRGKAVSI